MLSSENEICSMCITSYYLYGIYIRNIIFTKPSTLTEDKHDFIPKPHIFNRIKNYCLFSFLLTAKCLYAGLDVQINSLLIVNIIISFFCTHDVVLNAFK